MQFWGPGRIEPSFTKVAALQNEPTPFHLPIIFLCAQHRHQQRRQPMFMERWRSSDIILSEKKLHKSWGVEVAMMMVLPQLWTGILLIHLSSHHTTLTPSPLLFFVLHSTLRADRRQRKSFQKLQKVSHLCFCSIIATRSWLEITGESPSPGEGSLFGDRNTFSLD